MEDLSKLTRADLLERDDVKALGLPASASKASIIEAIVAQEQARNAGAPDEPQLPAGPHVAPGPDEAAPAESDAFKFDDDDLLVTQLVENASDLFPGTPSFLVERALIGGGQPVYKIDDARKLVDALINTRVEEG